ncbi:hypothetical protein B0T14DRAFT_525753 [Immersiella caudata]|uniref:Extracellular membrane protein CFEM domain-containing protein n=1 Tax=Immersiella caudata TaxID=314043 RepID=A0AA39WLQ3_9PEZI|nr:hypothetical protein B0T14DRAFT_525753 [Immersiella caudata]
MISHRPNILLHPLLFLVSVLATATQAAMETPMQNLSAFTSAAETKPCATECAITPSASFKAQHTCDPVNPVSCICANGTASAELHDAMSTYCYEKCDGFIGVQLATAILVEYCGQSWGGNAMITDAPVTSTSSVTSNPTRTGTADPAAGGGLTKEEKIILATVIPVVGLIVAALALWVAWKQLKRRREEGEEGLALDVSRSLTSSATRGNSNEAGVAR